MSAVAAPAAGPSAPPARDSLTVQLRVLSKRSVSRTLRQPFVTVPTFVFPLFFLAVNASGLAAATANPGFPTDNYLTFALATAFVQAAMSAVMVAGGGLAEDIHTGFLSRLMLTRANRAAIVLGHLSGTVAIGLIGTAAYLAIALAFGAHVETGVGGVLVVFGLTMLISLTFGCIGVLAALRSKTADAVQAIFPLLFVLLFLSSMSIPRNLIEKDWFEQVASYNPMSYLIEGPRSLLVVGWNSGALVRCIALSLIVIVLSLILSSRQMQKRFVRT